MVKYNTELLKGEKIPNKTLNNCKIAIDIKLNLLLVPPILLIIIPPNIFPINEENTIVIEYDQKITLGFFSDKEFCK